MVRPNPRLIAMAGGFALLCVLVAGVAGSFPIPVTIVPGDLSDEDIDALS